MRSEDRKKLEVSLGENESLEAGFARALGVEVPAVRRLYQEIFDDLDDEVFGVRWWATHVGTSRRILISHHLVECVKSVETNLVEASLHLVEAADYWEQESDFWADVVARRPDGRLEYQSKQRASPAEDLPRRLATLHAVGFVRAIGSALDCLGACIIGVLALRKNLLLADFWKAKHALEKAVVGKTAARHELHQRSYRLLDAAIADVGPKGWVEWLFDLRNMVVHRGRRFHMKQLLPKSEQIFGADGQVVPRMMAVEQLPNDPALSQVEAFVIVDRTPPVLTEHAELTLRGIRKSTVDLTSLVMRELVDAWLTRRKNPELLIQPEAQWPEGRSEATTGFVGYRAGIVPYDPTEMRTDRDTWRKFRTAALADETRGRWASFD